MRKKAAILDDDGVFAGLLKKKIENLFAKYSLDFSIDVFLSASELAKSDEVYQLLFMDVIMPGKDGITVVREYRELGKVGEVVYVSAYEGEVFDSFESEPLCFVRKGHLDGDLEKAVGLYNNRRKASRVTIREGTRIHIFHAEEIRYLASNRHYIDLYMVDGDKVVIRGKMDDMERALGDYGFVRIHISYLVNLDYAVTVSRQQLQMDDGKVLRITARYRAAIAEKLQFHLQDKKVRGGGR